MNTIVKDRYLRQTPDNIPTRWPSLLALLVLAAGLFHASALFADESKPVIRSVIISGNTYVAADIILAKISSRQGADYHEQQVNEDARNILALPQIIDVRWESRAEGSSIDLTFFITEARRIAEIEIRGNKNIKTKKILKELLFKAEDPLDIFRIRNGQQAIKDLYIKKGYHAVQVAIDETELDTNQRVVYVIVEGPRLRINKVTFTGNDTLPTWKLKKQIKTKPYFFIFRKGLLADDRLEQDALALAKYYHDQGFLDARVFARKKFNQKKTRSQIEFVIEEGLRYRVVALEFSGNQRFSDQELDEKVSLEIGDVLTDSKRILTERAVKRYYGKDGYIFCTVALEKIFTDREGEVLAKINISEGGDFYLNRLIIKGNNRTKDKVVRRAFDHFEFLPGKIYDAEAMEKGRKRLRQTALFDNVTVNPVGDDPNSRDALVEVTERQTGLVTFGVGVGSNSGAFGQFSIQEKNFDIGKFPKSLKEWKEFDNMRGGGQTLSLNLFPGTRETRGNIRFREPYLFDKPYYLETEVFIYRRGRESYDEARKGGRVTLGHYFNTKWSADVSVNLERVNISDLDRGTGDDDNDFAVPIAVEDARGETTMTSLRFGLNYDGTDSLTRPTEGNKFNTSWEQFGAFGGEEFFAKYQVGASHFKTVHEYLAERRTVWSSRIQYATVLGQAPVFERYNVGGIGSMRGFDYRGISKRGGPENDPYGSDFQILAGTEITHPLYEETVYGKLFYDTAMIEAGSVRMAAGFGLEIMIPQLFQEVPMQFNFGIPINKADSDDTEVFSFSMGFHF